MSPGYLAAPEAEEEATQKEFCDKEIGKTKVIKDDDGVKHKVYCIDDLKFENQANGIDEFNTKEVDTTSKNREKEL